VRKSDLFFLLAVASIPLQLNKFFFFDFSYVLGIPIDYRAPAVYLSDLIIIGYLAFFFLEHQKGLTKIISLQKKIILILTVFNLYLFTSSLLFSESKEASIFFNARILLFSLTAIAGSSTLSKPQVMQKLSVVFGFSMFWQSIVLILQFIFQRSLGLWFLGERAFDVSTTSIAHIQVLGKQFLRPYGTFPHPNVAAAYLVIGLILVWGIRAKITKFTAIVAILLTGSKTALVTLAGLLIVQKPKYFLLAVGIILIALLIFLRSIPDPQIASIAERLVLLQAALDIAVRNPLFGVGSNNFILELSRLDISSLAEIRLLQPVHNVFLLILAENGLVGLLLFAALLLTVLKKAKSAIKLALFISLLVFASVDHFLWTLHQGQLLFWLSISYVISKNNNLRKSAISAFDTVESDISGSAKRTADINPR